MQKPIRFLVMIAIGLGFLGCSSVSTYTIKVNGYTDPGSPGLIKPGGSFCIMENPEAKNPLLEKEISGKITRLLEVRGYAVTTFEKADYYLFFAYGLGEPRSVSVTQDYYGGFGWGWGGGYGWGGPAVAVGIPWGGSTYSANLYDRWLLIKVVEGPAYRTQKTSPPVWVGEARSVGTSSDLRSVLNYLLVANFKEFGKNTGQAVTVEIKADNPEVYSLTH
ncbi:MAG TPA: DUF4136 domain-containing protein [Desulfobaccales bacterium]|nr:DUF4136 domain-containing protein [Desulfobaccales bacterium]